MTDILVLYYSRHGHVREMAAQIARGVMSVPGANPRLRTVPPWGAPADAVPDDGAPFVTKNDLRECAALIATAAARGISLPDNVASYLLRRLPRDWPALHAALAMLDTASLSAGRSLTVPFVREVLRLEE